MPNVFRTQPSDSDYQQLVNRCRSLPPAQGNYLVHDYVENLLITVLDFMMRVIVVKRAIDHYRQHARKEIADFAALKNLLAKYPDTKEGNRQIARYLWGYNLWTRVALLRRFVEYFEARGVTTQEQLRQWAFEADFEQDFKGKIKGADIAIFKWLVMRQGVEAVKPDVWIHRFIWETLGYSVNDQTAAELLERAAQELGVRAYELDWRIWEYQTGNRENLW
ncbi:MAG: hypothetical protein KBH93_12140 [Anaerolineae bacterium]|nr:hypothetical protein [Anaerolineae bacterium]